MSQNPQFMFDFGSPNAFLSHEAIPAIEKRTGAKFEYVPVLLGGIFKATNNKSPAETLAGVKNKPEFNALQTEKLWVKEALAGTATSLKRFTPKARGSAGPIVKRNCHVKIVLSDE